VGEGGGLRIYEAMNVFVNVFHHRILGGGLQSGERHSSCSSSYNNFQCDVCSMMHDYQDIECY